MSRKLDLIDIIDIIYRRNNDERATDLAREYSVSIARISQIFSNQEHHLKRWNKFLGKSDKYREDISHENDVDHSGDN
jgi:hypothetical protein